MTKGGLLSALGERKVVGKYSRRAPRCGECPGLPASPVCQAKQQLTARRVPSGGGGGCPRWPCCHAPLGARGKACEAPAALPRLGSPGQVSAEGGWRCSAALSGEARRLQRPELRAHSSGALECRGKEKCSAGVPKGRVRAGRGCGGRPQVAALLGVPAARSPPCPSFAPGLSGQRHP